MKTLSVILIMVFLISNFASASQHEKFRIQPKENSLIICTFCRDPIGDELTFECHDQCAKVHQSCVEGGEYNHHCSSCKKPFDLISKLKLTPFSSFLDQTEIYNELETRVRLIQELWLKEDLLRKALKIYEQDGFPPPAEVKNRITFIEAQTSQLLKHTLEEGKEIEFDIGPTTKEALIEAWQRLDKDVLYGLSFLAETAVFANILRGTEGEHNPFKPTLSEFAAFYAVCVLGLVFVGGTILSFEFYKNYTNVSKHVKRGHFSIVLKDLMKKHSCITLLERYQPNAQKNATKNTGLK